jgi:tripeptide aminopeptidase
LDALCISLDNIGSRPAGESSGIDPLIEAIRRIWMRHGYDLKAVPMSTNINVPVAYGWPCVCVGLFQGGHVHRNDEFLLTDSISTGRAMLTELTDTLLTWM